MSVTPVLKRKPAPQIGELKLGADLADRACDFLVWAPRANAVDVHLFWPEEFLVRMDPAGDGYHHAVVQEIRPHTLYTYLLNGESEYPDPASRSQPHGVHGASEVIGKEFAWTDDQWRGIPLDQHIYYEIHTGTYTPEGTLDGIVPHLGYLTGLGVTALELMPVAQFPGQRNWGYDGVYPFAVHTSYGGADGLKRLVDAAHGHGLAVMLDVVYNHLGPEGNYLGQFGPYFTGRYRTPWGDAINFDGPDSEQVRRYFVENALYWITEFHIDGLRLDAVHSIFDQSPTHILSELAGAVHQRGTDLGRRVHVIAESDLNESRVVRGREEGGYSLDAQWSDDFHHALHTLLTREREGYYRDFGSPGDLAKAYRDGFVYSGQYSVCRHRPHGTSTSGLAPSKFVVCSQNHDQVGNRMRGERLSQLLPLEACKLAAGSTILSPYRPLLFMGEEYGEKARFLYFTSHSDPDLVQAVREGRKREFASFDWTDDVPDPQAESTFRLSCLDHHLRERPQHRALLDFYRALIRLRKGSPAFAAPSREHTEVLPVERRQALLVRTWTETQHMLLVLHFGRYRSAIEVPLPVGLWKKVLDSADARWLGTGNPGFPQLYSDGGAVLYVAPMSCAVYELQEGK